MCMMYILPGQCRHRCTSARFQQLTSQDHRQCQSLRRRGWWIKPRDGQLFSQAHSIGRSVFLVLLYYSISILVTDAPTRRMWSSCLSFFLSFCKQDNWRTRIRTWTNLLVVIRVRVWIFDHFVIFFTVAEWGFLDSC